MYMKSGNFNSSPSFTIAFDSGSKTRSAGLRSFRVRLTSALTASLFATLLFLSSCSSSSNSKEKSSDSLATDTLSPEFRLISLSKQITHSPSNYMLYKERSLLFYETGNTIKAIEDVDSALAHNESGPDLWHLRGYYYYQLKNDDTALANFKKAVELGSENPETYYQIGQINFLRGELAEADRWYEGAIYKDSLDPIYDFSRALIYEKKKDIKNALKYFNRSLDKDPRFIRSLASLHDIYFNNYKDYKKAQEYNDRILKVDSLHPIGHFNEGNRFLDLAMGIYDSLKSKEFEALIQLAISEYSVAISSNPAYTQAWYNRGYCNFLIDEFDPAITDFEKTVSLDPANEKAHFMLGSIKEHFQDIESARQHYEKALELQPGFKEAAEAVRELKGKGR